MIHLFYYETGKIPTSLKLNRQIKKKFQNNLTKNDVLIIDQYTYSFENWKDIENLSNNIRIISSKNVDYELLQSSEIHNIYIFDFLSPDIIHNNIVENIIKIKSITADVVGISLKFLNNQLKHVKQLQEIFKDVKEIQLKNDIDSSELGILLKLKENFSDSLIDLILNHYIVKNNDISLKTVNNFQKIFNRKRAA